MAYLLAEVKSAEFLSPNLRRLTFFAEGLGDCSEEILGLHIKVFIPKEGQDRPVVPKMNDQGRPVWPSAEEKPYARAYTIADFDKEKQELAIDFVMHKKGPASIWASEAKLGSVLAFVKPTQVYPMLAEAENYLFVGDLSSLTAMKILLERLDDKAVGEAFIQIPSLVDQLDLKIKSPALKVNWIISNQVKSTVLSEAVQACDWPEGEVSAWVAGESREVVRIKKYLRGKGLKSKEYYAIPYWKEGENEEEYHAERHEIMDEVS